MANWAKVTTMEFKIWGRLDDEGRIQSIQSSCSGHNQNAGTLPYTCSDSLLAYSEKKKLVYQLDAKTDEMSLLILQMSEMSKRIELQEKLIAQYEDTCKRQKKELERLQRENDFFRNKGVPESSSNREATHEVPSSFNAPVTTFEMTCNLRCKPLKYASCPTITTSNGRWSNTFEEDHVSSTGSENTQSCSSGCESEQSSSNFQTSIASPGDCESESSNSVSYIRDKSNSVFQNVTQSVDEKVDGSSDERVGEKVVFDFDGASNQTDESKLQNWDEYVFAGNDGKIFRLPGDSISHDSPSIKTNENCDTSKDVEGAKPKKANSLQTLFLPVPHSASSDSGSPKSLETDRDGYLILDRPEVRQSASVIRQTEPEVRQTEPEVRQIAHEDIHGTWLSVNFKIHQSHVRTSEALDDVDGACVPSSPDKDLDTTITATKKEKPPIPAKPARPSKWKSRTTHVYAEISEKMLDPVITLKRASEPATVLTQHVEEVKRPSESVVSDDDMCNSYIRTMKTTMEWAKAKKGLLKESNEMTVEKIETMLRDSVQEIFTALRHYEAEKPYRINKPVTEKAVGIQRKLRHSRVTDIISDDFLTKCIMVCTKKGP